MKKASTVSRRQAHPRQAYEGRFFLAWSCEHAGYVASVMVRQFLARCGKDPALLKACREYDRHAQALIRQAESMQGTLYRTRPATFRAGAAWQGTHHEEQRCKTP